MVQRVGQHGDVDSAVASFLDGAAARPKSMTVDGEGGMGKTTLLTQISDEARRRGFRVLTSMAAAAEATLAYAGLADLLGSVGTTQLARLAEPQRDALDRVLLRSTDSRGPIDTRAVLTAFVSVLNRLSERGPVLICVDDAQWLDRPSAEALSFAARRVTGRVGFVCTVRTELAGRHSALRLMHPDDEIRLRVPPMPPSTMHAMIRDRLGVALPLPTLTRVHRISGGNPMFALELARFPLDSQESEPSLSETLAEIVAVRVDGLDPDVAKVLLVAACAEAPTVEIVRAASALGAVACDSALGVAETAGILVITGDNLRFSHPLLAQGVLSRASAAERRDAHRRLADVVTDPGQRARHLAHGTTGRDPATVVALDAAADSARRNGAPTEAAEFIELALSLGGDTPERRITLAHNAFASGDPIRARILLEDALHDLPPGALRGQAYNLLATVFIFSDSFAEAADLLERALTEKPIEPVLRVKMLLSLAFTRYNIGLAAGGVAAATDAVAAARAVGDSNLISQSLGMRAILGFLTGEGIDDASIARAVALEGDTADVPVAMRATVQDALMRAWSGQNPMAHREIDQLCQGALETGDEFGLFFAAFQAGIVEIWHGELEAAAIRADDLLERARLVDRDVPLFVAHSLRAWVAAYAGNEPECRRDISAALERGLRSHSPTLLLGGTIHVLGFLETSLGNYEAALTALEPNIRNVEAAPAATEMIIASFLPDAVEAAIAVGRDTLAETLVEYLEANGRRLNRPWMLATWARGRSMLQAARGEFDDAVASIRQALDHHRQLPIPFERARSQLFYGQLLRRMRAKDAAAAELSAAIRTFEEIGMPLWVRRGHAELARANVGPHRKTGLTPSEERVAALAAVGMTNREVAVALFISPKTVEANLVRVYRKLGIRTRAELGKHMGRPSEDNQM